jgi:hypothetical protein
VGFLLTSALSTQRGSDLAQDELPQDTDVLRTLVRDNRIQIGDLGQFPCTGVYRGDRCAGNSADWRSRHRCQMTPRDWPRAVLRFLTDSVARVPRFSPFQEDIEGFP